MLVRKPKIQSEKKRTAAVACSSCESKYSSSY